jgi:3-oxoacyl-[acyl-carrier protein] reductase
MSLAAGRKVALITGGSQGIGAATARVLVKKGYRVAINYSSNSEKAEALVRDLGDQNAICIKADASKITGIECMVAETVQKYGKIDAVITAAARLGLQELADTVEAGFDDLFALNVKGPFFLAQVLPRSKSQKSFVPELTTLRKHSHTCRQAHTSL